MANGKGVGRPGAEALAERHGMDAPPADGSGAPAAQADHAPGPRGAPVLVKKYANRRLYHTGTSAYVTLEDLAAMVKRGEEFLVTDARSGEDLTRAVLTQIIVEQEGKGQSLLPESFLRGLIRFYGGDLQAVVPSYLEMSLERLGSEQVRLRELTAKAFGAPFAAGQVTPSQFTGSKDAAGKAFGAPAMALLEEQARANMAMFQEALRVFTPFVPRRQAPALATEDVAALKRELDALRARLDRLDEG